MAAATADGIAPEHKSRSESAATPNGTPIKQAAIPESALVPDQLPVHAPTQEPAQHHGNRAVARKWFVAGSLASLAAVTVVRRAIAMNPSDSTAHHWYGLYLARMGRGRQALSELDKALSLDPLSLIVATDIAETYYLYRQPGQAMARIDEVLTLNPDFAQAHVVKGKILEELHQYPQAEEQSAKSANLFGGGSRVDAVRGHALALAGEREEALRIAQDLETRSERRYTPGVRIAEIYCGLQQTDAAMKWLHRAFERHDTGIDMLRVDPLFDGCRSDSRFQELLSRIKLTE